MKSVKPLIGLVLVCSCLFAHAQKSVSPVYASAIEVADKSHVSLSDPYRIKDDFQRGTIQADAPGQRMIRVGKTLTIAGSVLFVSGIVMMATADEIYYRTTTDFDGNTVTEGDLQGALGLIMTTGGLGMIIPGAIVWSKGKKKYEAYQSAGASLSLGINKNGAGLRFRF